MIHTTMTRCLLLCGVLISTSLFAEDKDGFVQMFNGKDLTGWNTNGNWVIEEGNVLTLKPREGESGWQRYADYIATDRKYGDFVLDLEFKFNATGNSGVFMRVGDLKNHVTSGFEVQILDTHGKKKFNAHDCGGVIGTSAPAKMVVKPAGEWNRYTITLKGSHLKVVQNGVPIQDLDLSETKLNDRPAKGYISFQDEAKRIWYRNVRIKELK
ncbi:MAG: 3-keto-disaccharide hydrolase [Pirellulales bacterium]